VLGDLRVSLYDVFGYLFPGAISLASITILAWSLFLGTEALPIRALPYAAWIVIAVSAYISGHLTQAVANVLLEILPRKARHRRAIFRDLPAQIVGCAAVRVRDLFGTDLADEPYWLYRVSDEAVVQAGKNSDREIFVYREGFYRGLAVSFSALAAALVVRACVSQSAVVSVLQSNVVLSRGMVNSIAGVCAAASALSFLRYRRFADYRIGHAITSFITLTTNTSGSGQAGDGRAKA
jgi:hypothetical protein